MSTTSKCSSPRHPPAAPDLPCPPLLRLMPAYAFLSPTPAPHPPPAACAAWSALVPTAAPGPSGAPREDAWHASQDDAGRGLQQRLPWRGPTPAPPHPGGLREAHRIYEPGWDSLFPGPAVCLDTAGLCWCGMRSAPSRCALPPGDAVGCADGLRLPQLAWRPLQVSAR